MRLVLATANPHKATEIAEVLGPDFELVARPADVPEVTEDADSFEGNARLKSVALAAATGEPALATDAENVARLLAELSDVPTEGRTARFRCVLVVRWPDGREVVSAGAVDGHIVDRPRGVSGFGYDPVFAPDDASARGRTFAEMGPAEKHAISHRGRALRLLAGRLGRTKPVL